MLKLSNLALALSVVSIAALATAEAQTATPAPAAKRATKRAPKKAAVPQTESDTTAGAKAEVDKELPKGDQLPTPLPPENQSTGNPSQAPGQEQLASPETSQNRYQRALEGSRSAWSGQFKLTYNGSNVDRPFSEFAPNPDNDVPAPTVNINGTVGTRYRFSPNATAGLSVGVITYTPFQGPKGTSLYDPGVDYSYSYKALGANNRVTLSAGLWTQDSYTAADYVTYTAIQNLQLWEVGKTGLSLGYSLLAQVNTFDDNKDSQKIWEGGIYPFAEYRLNDRFNLRSVIGFGYANLRSAPDIFTLRTNKIYQTLGLGTSITDDFFLYTFVKFYPSPLNNIRNENSSVGCTVVLNLF